MLALIAAIALQAAASGPLSAASAPPPDAAPTLSPADELTQLEEVYREGCEVRAYGTFGDECTSLADQIAQFRRQMRRDEAQRERERKAIPLPTSPTPSPTPNPR